MFQFFKNNKNNSNLPISKSISKDEIARLLRTDAAALDAFEKSYQTNILTDVSDNFFEVNAKQAAASKEGFAQQDVNSGLDSLIDRIVNEFLSQTPVWSYDGEKVTIKNPSDLKDKPVTVEELMAVPEEIRPQCAGEIMKKDISDPSYIPLMEMYNKWQKGNLHGYHMFRQGLDILDLDPITYEIISTNPNSMGYWLPAIVDAVKDGGFFKIPKTKIIKVPLCMLQLTRIQYELLTRTTLDIVDKFCQKVFELDEYKEYFIKTGTYSSKFDFRNARVTGPKEVRELGEYLLFIHYQALQMASPLSQPCIYGVSTTNEWVVREFIPDKENNPCIYKGLPLHTEYRVFVDFDTDEILGINSYWDPEVMKQRFGHEEDADSPHNVHDYVIYSAHEETLMKRYEENKEIVLAEIKKILPDISLQGQYSIDIMQNGCDFYIIDMALAQDSALIKCVPEEKRRKLKENWIPKLDVR